MMAPNDIRGSFKMVRKNAHETRITDENERNVQLFQRWAELAPFEVDWPLVEAIVATCKDTEETISYNRMIRLYMERGGLK
jgi:hypothetical protein